MRIVTAVALLAALFAAGCDGGIYVVGSVADGRNRPVTGAEIVLERPSSSRILHAQSDSNGCFGAGGVVAPGHYEYTLHVRAEGFKEATAQVETLETNRVAATLQPVTSSSPSVIQHVAASTCDR